MRGGSRTENKASNRSSHSAMKFKGMVECFRFAFGFLIFVRPENFLAQVMCARIFQKPSEEWNELASEKLYLSNALKAAELNPISKFELGPFEIIDDSFYQSRMFPNTIDDNSENRLKEIPEIFEDGCQQTQQRIAAGKRVESAKRGKAKEAMGRRNKETSNCSEEKQTIDDKIYPTNRLNQAQSRSISSPQDQRFSPIHQNFWIEINKMKLQMKKIKKLSRLMLNLQTDLQEFENSSLVSLEKLLQMLEELKKTTVNNLFQVDSILFINGFPAEDTRKEADAQLASFAAKEILNNLKEETALPHTPVNPSASPNASMKPYDLDLFKQLQNNFSKIFHNQDVTLEQINQMSKIVDFVDRYRGEVGNLKNMDLKEEEDSRRMKKKGEESRGVKT